MNRKSILIILPSLASGGAEKVILSLVENFDKNLYNIKLLILCNDGPLKPKINLDNIINLNTRRFRFAFVKIIKEIKFHKPDLILSTFPHITLPLLLFKKLKLINSFIISREPNMIDSSLNNIKFSYILKILLKYFLPTANKIIVSSEVMHKDLIEKGISEKKIKLIHNPVDDLKLRNIDCFNRFPGLGLRLVYVGRLEYQKGLDRLIPIIKNINNVHLTILGDGSEYKNLNYMVNKLGLRGKVTFNGYSTIVNSYIASADYFVLPSRWEGLPNVVLESLVLGTPVITFNEIEGLLDLVPHVKKNKLFFCKDELDMECLIKNLSNRPDYRNIVLRENLLKKFNTPKNYCLIMSSIIQELLFAK